MRRWEYTARTYTHETLEESTPGADIDALGKEGWELVSVVPSPMGGELTFWFKRELAPILNDYT